MNFVIAGRQSFDELSGPASWSSGNAFVSGAGGLRFKSRGGQIGHSVANARHRCNISSKGAVVARAQ